jgi:hypothetical protein
MSEMTSVMRLEPFSTEIDEHREIEGIMDRATEKIGSGFKYVHLVVDRTGYQTVIRAQVGRE